MDKFLTWHGKLEVTGNYSTVTINNYSKTVVGTFEQKGVSKSKRGIENYMDASPLNT